MPDEDFDNKIAATKTEVDESSSHLKDTESMLLQEESSVDYDDERDEDYMSRNKSKKSQPLPSSSGVKKTLGS